MPKLATHKRLCHQKTDHLKDQSVFELDTFSTDFKEHPVAYLIAKVLEQHNRDQFEVFGYSFMGPVHAKCDSACKVV